MKKILILISIMCVSLITKAQLNLMHSFQINSEGEGIIEYLPEINSWESVMEPIDFYILKNNSNVLTGIYNIYNQNFVLIKQIDLTTIPVSSPDPSNYPNQPYPAGVIRCLGKHLINTDDKIEFLVGVNFYNNSTLGYVNRQLIINEDKEIVFIFDLKVNDFSGIYKIGNQLIIVTQESTYYNTSATIQNYYNIYSLGGNYNPNTMVTYTHIGDYQNPYPNPSLNTITLPYTLCPGETTQMKVFNINGQLVDVLNISSDFDKVLLNVNGYPKGTYIYTYNNISKKFVVQ